MSTALKELLRMLGFVALHTAIVGAYLGVVSELLPPLREEGPAVVVLPATALAAIALALMHPIVRAARTHAMRFVIYASFTAQLPQHHRGRRPPWARRGRTARG